MILVASMVLASFFSLVIFPEEASAYAQHSPIRIAGDLDFTAANGVTQGDGTPSNPYIIEGWEITAPGGDAITVRVADAYFIVRDIHIHSTDLGDRGIYLYYADNGRVENATISNNMIGIFTQSSGVTVENSEISNNTYGIVSNSSVNVTIMNNDISDNAEGIVLGRSRRATIKDNRVANGDIGISLTDSEDATISANTFSGMAYGVYLVSSSNVSITGNLISPGVSSGIYLDRAENTVISGNDISNGDYGITASNSNGSYIRGNSVRFSGVAGLYFYCASNGSIEDNTIRQNKWGVILNQSAAIMAYHNDLIDNNLQAVDNRAGVNSWDNGYPSGGNFWTDFASPDQFNGPGQDQAGSDGIGDYPYVFSLLGVQDNYPLMAQHASKNPPAALFTIQPQEGLVAAAFSANASSSMDLETPSGNLEIRWDWENDGVWDTAWSANKTSQHQYSTQGVYDIRLQVRDTDGLLNVTTRRITVSVTTTTAEPTFPWWLVVLVVAVVVVFLAFLILWMKVAGRTRAIRRQP